MTDRRGLVVAVTTCPRNRDREDAVRTTWGDQLPDGLRLYYVLGDDGGRCPRVEGDRVFLPTPDAYEHLARKTWALLRWAVEELEFDHILKCDDDSYVHLPAVASLDLAGVDYAGTLIPPAPGIIERWHIGKCTDPSYERPTAGPFPRLFAEGFGYVLSRRAAEIVATTDEAEVLHHVLEDAFVGLRLESAARPLAWVDLGDDRILKRRRAWEPSESACVRHPFTPEDLRRAHARFAGAGLVSSR